MKLRRSCGAGRVGGNAVHHAKVTAASARARLASWSSARSEPWAFPGIGARTGTRSSPFFVDREKLPATYDRWLRRAGRAEKEFKRQGTIAERVYLDPAEFAGWCVARGLNIEAAARMSFATEAVAGKYRNQS
jgi:hypothetical protein